MKSSTVKFWKRLRMSKIKELRQRSSNHKSSLQPNLLRPRMAVGNLEVSKD